MEMKNVFKRIFDCIGSVCNKTMCAILGEMTLKEAIRKLVGEIILALLIASAVYGATALYDIVNSNRIENDQLNQLYVSVSNEYVESLFGKPYIQVDEAEELKSSFYVLNGVVLRTVSDNDSVVAFFITAVEKSRKVPVDSYEDQKRIIGKMKYSDVAFTNPVNVANTAMSGRYTYYSELQETGRYGMFNSYIYGTAPYGFVDSETIEFIRVSTIENESSQKIQSLKEKAYPNTFGVIASGYEEKISIIPLCEDWDSIYYMLTRH